MNEPSLRLTEAGAFPTQRKLTAWIGKEGYVYWKRLIKWIEENYPNVFTPDWLFAGKKHGWALRYKKGKSFCTFVPEKHRFKLLIVFGGAERDKVEGARDQFSPETLKLYDEAKTYHDGKWLLLAVDSDRKIEDVTRFLTLKRKPRMRVSRPANKGVMQ